MPIKAILVRLSLGIVAAAALVGLIVFIQRGSTPRLTGQITGVRTLGMDQSSSVATVDFHFTNSSRYPFIVASTTMTLVDSSGQAREGRIISASDIHQLFELFPALGLKAGEPLVIKTRIQPGASHRVMLAARFEVPKPELDARKKITVSIAEVDGAVSELSQ